MMPSATTSTPAPTVERSGRSLRILYAEDMPELRDLVRIVLGREGHIVETVPDGAQAAACLCNRTKAYDLLITDHHMPLMNGIELVQSLRRAETPFAGKIMVFSSEASPTIHAEYRALRVDHVLPKPVFPATLREALQHLFPANA